MDRNISIEELREAVYKQNNNKSSGIDKIVAEIYKCSFDILAPFMLILFNWIFNTGVYPRLWGNGMIVPIFKGGNIDNARNYRGITLINIIEKVYSQILHTPKQINKIADNQNSISAIQFGFQKGKSTVDCIFILNAIISKTLSEKKKLYCAFIDFITISLLFQKLLREGVSTKLTKAFKSMYETVKACIRYKSEMSNFFDSNIGVKQGDQSSILLFLLFINDILSYINTDIDGLFTLKEMKVFLLPFADDAIGYSLPKNLKRYNAC